MAVESQRLATVQDRPGIAHRLELVERAHRAVQVEAHVFVEQYIAKTRQPDERLNEIAREVESLEVPDRRCVVVKAELMARGQLTRDIDHELADR